MSIEKLREWIEKVIILFSLVGREHRLKVTFPTLEHLADYMIKNQVNTLINLKP